MKSREKESTGTTGEESSPQPNYALFRLINAHGLRPSTGSEVKEKMGTGNPANMKRNQRR